MEFHEKVCTPCRGGVPPLTGEKAAAAKFDRVFETPMAG